MRATVHSVPQPFRRVETPNALKPAAPTLQVDVECRDCRKIYTLHVNGDKYRRWIDGEGLVQYMLPELTEGERELLVSGNCNKCTVAMFRPRRGAK